MHTTVEYVHSIKLLTFLFVSSSAAEAPTTQTKVLICTILTAHKNPLKYSWYSILGTESI